MYILRCADGSYYTGSTDNLARRIEEHQAGEGANYTKNKLPVKLVYVERFDRVDKAFYREKQVQGWNRAKKEALIKKTYGKLPELSLNYTEYGRPDPSLTNEALLSAQPTVPDWKNKKNNRPD